ncbi:anti-sigma factor [Asticcacaulis sp. SL142]|uniref:anti-sigma factor family protein n=1 Tax=Asticcacaulis sp. SL142 TaxID=2995155 RepID=UPI00226C6CC7|nr:anti-sigma factor [Asticcacaulis sp. SL142]WAC48286.1 anti-sigma factor [Asticcacaulis sp. SL142]
MIESVSDPVTEDDLHAFVDGHLTPERVHVVEMWLKAHPKDAQRVSIMREQTEALRDMFRPVAEEPLPSRLRLNHIQERVVAKRRGALVVPLWRAAAASALLLIGGAGGWGLRQASLPQPEGLTALIEEASASYVVYAPDRERPVEIRASDRQTLSHWAQTRLGYTPALPDLSPAGYRLMGGRVVATPRGPALMIMYDDDHGSRFVLFTRTMNHKDREAPLRNSQDGDLRRYAWASSGIGYSLVGAAPDHVLRSLAQRIQSEQGRFSS